MWLQKLTPKLKSVLKCILSFKYIKIVIVYAMMYILGNFLCKYVFINTHPESPLF